MALTMICNKDIIGTTCRCKNCKPRSLKQLTSDRRQKYKAMRRAKMEAMPEFLKDYKDEIMFDPVASELAPDPLTDDLKHEESESPFRGDYIETKMWESIHGS